MTSEEVPCSWPVDQRFNGVGQRSTASLINWPAESSLETRHWSRVIRHSSLPCHFTRVRPMPTPPPGPPTGVSANFMLRLPSVTVRPAMIPRAAPNATSLR